MNKSVVLMSLMLASLSAQAADFTPVCERTAPVAAFLATATGKACADITAADLAPITRVAVPDAGITELQVGDFTGLPNLQILNIKGNPYTSLPRGLTADLPNLQTLVIFETGLTSVPSDFLENNPLIENLYMFGNPFTTLPNSVWKRLSTYQHWAGIEFDKAFDDANADRLSTLFANKAGVSFILH